MAKTKKKEILKKSSLGEDMKHVNLPFELFAGFAATVEEIQSKSFEYENSIIDSNTTILNFKSEEKQEKITINITKDNLLIKQFSDTNNHEKLKVIYVVKDSGRNFKLL